jgi:hypothetical protein
MEIHLDSCVLEHVELFHRLYFSLLRRAVMIPLTKENSNTFSIRFLTISHSIELGKCAPRYCLSESDGLD